jgi:serine/threonine protein kinase/Flp pilus assembly protein TadD
VASPSNSERWDLLNRLFDQALSLKNAERAAFVAHSCGQDAELREELESLLAAASDSDDTLISDAVRQAADAIWSGDKQPVLAPGALISHYRVERLIGAGGMGQVYVAEDVRLRRRVALKTLAPDYVHDRGALARFETEARAASALSHPNIATIYEIDQFENIHFIACEFVEGETLREKMRAGALPVSSAVEIATQIATGLAAAHALGITHRDIKPENILVRSDGLVKIVDFGIAKLAERPRAARQTVGGHSGPLSDSILCTTAPGMVLGTARYMSPEQARGAPVDGRSDLFSLGTVLYEMVSGRPPFEGETTSDLISEILKTDPPALHQLAPAIPLKLSRIAAKAISKDPAARYATAGQFAEDLRTLGKPITFSHVQTISSQRISRRALIAAIAVLIAILAVFSVIWWERRPVAGPGQPRTLAILPFRNLKPDAGTDFLSFSLADAAITKFAGIGSLVVRPSSSVERYRNREIDPDKVAAELHVNTLLTGTYLKEGDDLRLSLQLVNVNPATILWQRTMDVQYENLRSVQDTIAEQIIAGLSLRLTEAESARVRFDNSIDPLAYEDYLRGVDLYATNDFHSAIDMLERAAALAPSYALTWAHLGRAYTTNASLAFGGREQYAKAQAAYEKALRLNPSLVETRVYMANLLTDTGRVEEAVPLLREALRANPNYAEAHWELGYAYRFAGLLDKSVAECETARRLDPEVKLHSSAFNSYLYTGEYDKFLASLPHDETAYILFYRGFGEFYKHDHKEAARYFERAYRTDPSLLQAEVGEALRLGMDGRTREGLHLLEQTDAKVRERGVEDGEGIYKIAQAFAVLGDKRAALRVFQRTVAGGFFCYPYFQSDPLLANIRRERAFSDILAQARSRHDRFAARFAQ